MPFRLFNNGVLGFFAPCKELGPMIFFKHLYNGTLPHSYPINTATLLLWPVHVYFSQNKRSCPVSFNVVTP